MSSSNSDKVEVKEDKVEVTVDVDEDDKNPDDIPEQSEGHAAPKIALMGHDREHKTRSKDVVVESQFEDLDFADMQISDAIVKGLKVCRYDKPTPIQLRAIPLGKLNYGECFRSFMREEDGVGFVFYNIFSIYFVDLLLQAKSGTGRN